MSRRPALVEGRPRPAVRVLTPEQIAGQACLWCASVLEEKCAVALPEQRLRLGAEPSSWYPRRCPGC